MRPSTQHRIELGGRRLDYRVIRSPAARILRVRVSPRGVEVLRPSDRDDQDVTDFLARNEAWLFDQIERIERLGEIRIPERRGGW